MAGEIPEDNPVTTVWKADEDTLTREETHEKPVTRGTTWNIVQVKAEIVKNEGIAKIWTDKNISLQAIVDKWDVEKPKE